jgi:hypothetical protein
VGFAAGVVASVIGAGISLMRGGHRSSAEEPAEDEEAAADLLIGDAESGAMIWDWGTAAGPRSASFERRVLVDGGAFDHCEVDEGVTERPHLRSRDVPVQQGQVDQLADLDLGAQLGDKDDGLHDQSAAGP